MVNTKLPDNIELNELKIKISVTKELSHYDRDTIYDRIDEIVEMSYYGHTNFVLELPLDLLYVDNGINKKITDIKKQIDDILLEIHKTAQDEFIQVIENIKQINEKAKIEGDVIQIIEGDYIGENILVSFEDEERHDGLNKVLFFMDNEENTPIGWLLVNLEDDQVTETHSSF